MPYPGSTLSGVCLLMPFPGRGLLLMPFPGSIVDALSGVYPFRGLPVVLPTLQVASLPTLQVACFAYAPGGLLLAIGVVPTAPFYFLGSNGPRIARRRFARYRASLLTSPYYLGVPWAMFQPLAAVSAASCYGRDLRDCPRRPIDAFPTS